MNKIDTSDTSSILGSEETLFRNLEVFNPDHVPEQFLFRDSQLKELTYAVKPAMRSGRPTNCFLIGNPATGKTTSVRLVFEQLKASTQKVIPVYINCHLQSSAYKIFSEIRKAVLGMAAPDTGIPITRVQDEVFGRLARDKKTLVVCLDDINYLFASGIADDVLYSILRCHESVPGARASVFAISTEEVLHRLDDRVRSIFSPIRVEFGPYKAVEMLDILGSRSTAGLYPDILSKPLLKRIAGSARDLRHGIELVKQAALCAEADASRMIKEEHVEKALTSMQPPEASGDKVLVLSIIREKGPIESGKLLSLVKEQRDITYSSFYRMIKKLESGRFIEIEHVSKGQGRTGLIRSV
jgi:cell division control protein 6